MNHKIVHIFSSCSQFTGQDALTTEVKLRNEEAPRASSGQRNSMGWMIGFARRNHCRIVETSPIATSGELRGGIEKQIVRHIC